MPRLNKPIEQINNIINELIPLASPVKRECEFFFAKNSHNFNIFLLVEGEIDTWRNNDHLLTATISAPAVLGLQGPALRYELHQFTLSYQCKIYYLPLSLALEKIQHARLLNDVLVYQSFLCDYLCYRDVILVNRSTHEVVCLLLKELSLYPEMKRVKINILSFIWKRTHLSRSGIMQELSNLKKMGYISINDWKLMDITNTFPDIPLI